MNQAKVFCKDKIGLFLPLFILKVALTVAITILYITALVYIHSSTQEKDKNEWCDNHDCSQKNIYISRIFSLRYVCVYMCACG